MAAINPVRGFGNFVGFAEETDWGTPVTPATNFLRVNSNSLRRVRVTQPSPDLGTWDSNSTNVGEWFVDEDRAEGSFEFNFAYDDSSLLVLKHLMGLVDTTGASNPWTHTYSLFSPQPEGLTILSNPGTTAFDAAQIFAGCLLSRGTITVTPGRPVLCSVDVMGKTSDGLEGFSPPTFSTKGNRVFQQHAGVATLGSDEVKYKQMIIRVDRGLESLHEVGSLNPSRPVESRLNVEIELTLAWQLAKFHNSYFGDTIENWGVTFNGGSSRTLAITGQNTKVMDCSEPVSAAGQVEQRVRLKCFKGTSNQGLSVVVTNSNSSATAN